MQNFEKKVQQMEDPMRFWEQRYEDPELYTETMLF